ncbi:MAG: 23S rRNA (uracil(1939)-C(5))-methyltransferase RlmD [Clostridium sp.]|jgi:23S rRNA (uracil1939-C5)-methyltransferase|nr:23S rRNA (uracil(1939)-C(5))-methyltransferase RlmD [Clostridium sp.]
MELSKNSKAVLSVTAMSLQGQGVAHHEGLAVFIPAAAIGDVLEVTVTKREKRLAYAKIDRIVTPGADRQEQACPVYPRCGGCAFRHVSYEGELRVKAQAVEDALVRLGKLSPRIEPIVPARETERYRNKAQYPVALADGRLRAGFFAPRSHRLIPCEDCLLQPAEFSRLTKIVLAHAEMYGITPYDERTGRGFLRHIYMRQSALDGKVLVCLVTNGGNAVPRQDELYQKLCGAAKICGLVQNINAKQTNVVLGGETRCLFGAPRIEDSVLGVALEVSPQSFYQVNHAQAERLYTIAGEAAATDGALLELHCGSGIMGLSMAGRCRELVGVDIVPSAIENAEKNAARNGIKNARFICADADEGAQGLIKQGLRPEVVLLDPPRTGCSAGLVDTVRRLAPRRVVYVSCNPATLARDCALFTQNGYSLGSVTPVDMFPRTAHVECVAVLERG